MNLKGRRQRLFPQKPKGCFETDFVPELFLSGHGLTADLQRPRRDFSRRSNLLVKGLKEFVDT